MKNRPLGIMQSFSNVAFKKDGVEVFSARVGSGGCFGPNPTIDTVNAAYNELQAAIQGGKAPSSANDFNTVSVGMNEYEASTKGAGVALGKKLKR